MQPPPAAGPTPGPAPGQAPLPDDVVRAAHAGGWLLSPAVAVVLGLMTLLLLAALVTRSVQRRRAGGTVSHAWTRRGLSASAVLALLALSVGAGVNTYAGYFPTLTAAERFLRGDETGTGSQDRIVPPEAGAKQGEVLVDPSTLAAAQAAHPSGAATLPGPTASQTGWQVQSLHFDDPGLRIQQRTVVLAVPPGYAAAAAAGHRYPVVYLLGGFPGRPSDWLVAGHAREVVDALVAHRLLPQVLLVAPDINGGFSNDSETVDQVGGPQVQTWLTRDVVGWVDTHLATLPRRDERVLVGMSSGGYAALNVGLRHSEEFGLIGAMEPYGDPGNVTNRLLGGSVALLHADSPSWYLPTEPFTRRLVAFMDVGDGARREDRQRVQGLADLLARRGQSVELRVEHGEGHTWTEALQGLPYALAFAGRHLGDPSLLATYPSSDFPTTHGSAALRKLSGDAGAARQRLLRRHRGVRGPIGPLGPPVPGVAVGAGFGPRSRVQPAASASPSGSAVSSVARS